jgi:hypothetical protein
MRHGLHGNAERVRKKMTDRTAVVKSGIGESLQQSNPTMDEGLPLLDGWLAG